LHLGIDLRNISQSSSRGRETLGSFTHWIFAALLTTFFPKMVTAFPPADVFLFFGGMMVLQLIWVKTMIPETKGVPLEQIQKQLGIV
jgi:MFS transporter, SP family, arabinose:H+ symporter